MSRAAYRAAAVDFLTDYAADASVRLQVYPGRPRTVNPPTGFVDVIRGGLTPFADSLFQHEPQVDLIVLHGLYDSKDAVEQADAFVDGFLAWAATRYHQAGANTTIRVASYEDLPSYVNDWVPPDQQRAYFGTQITLEGFETN